MTAAQLAEYKKIKAELREARMEIDFRDKAVTLLRGGRTCLGRKNRRVLHAASQHISFNATRAGNNSSTGKIYRAERKVIRGHGIMDLILTALRASFNSALGYRTPNGVH